MWLTVSKALAKSRNAEHDNFFCSIESISFEYMSNIAIKLAFSFEIQTDDHTIFCFCYRN